MGEHLHHAVIGCEKTPRETRTLPNLGDKKIRIGILVLLRPRSLRVVMEDMTGIVQDAPNSRTVLWIIAEVIGDVSPAVISR